MNTSNSFDDIIVEDAIRTYLLVALSKKKSL